MVRPTTNACGPQWAPRWLVPDVVLGLDLTAYCDEHDVHYWQGAHVGRGRSLPTRLVLRHFARRDADTLLLSGIHGAASTALQRDVAEGRWLPVLRFAGRVLAGWVYYAGVRVGGWLSYPWRLPDAR